MPSRSTSPSSSVEPSQSSSMPLQVASFPAGVPGVQLLTMVPFEQEVTPVAEQAPTPHVVGVEMKSSSVAPSQSSSIALQVASLAAGVPGVQLLTMVPFEQEVTPVA